MGINLASIRYFSSQQPFINEFKSSQSWVTQTPSVFNTREEDLLNLDSNGWVTSLPIDQEDVQYTQVGSLLFRDQETYLPGRYVVLYEGEGTIKYRFDAEKNDALSTPGRDVLDVTPSQTGILVAITETDPNQTGDYIRNIQVIPEAQEFNTTSSFNPEFLEKIEPFKTFRFMDWMETNNSVQTEWSDRPKPENARYSEIGVPVEVLVEFANETETDPWFTMPHRASDEYITNFANYVANNLDPDLDAYVEYSNEVWNGQFDQNDWAQDRAAEEFSDPNLSFLDWYSLRTTEVVEIWENAFNSDSERVIGVMGAQAANSFTGQRALDYLWSDTPLSSADVGIDAIAIAPYFGTYIGQPENRAQLESWTQEPDGGLNSLFRELTQEGLLDNSPEGGALAGAYSNIETYAQIAEQENVSLIAYEGGQHLAGLRGLENNQAITDLFITANRDSRMGDAYRDYLTQWSNFGGELFVHYSDIRANNKWGSWGALESVYQDSSPKYDALVEFFENPPNPPDPGNDFIGTDGVRDEFIFDRPLDSSGTSNTVINFVLGEDKIDVTDLGIAQFETLKPFINDNSNGNAVIQSTLQGFSFELEIQNIPSDRLVASDFIFSTDNSKDLVEGTDSDDDLFSGRGNDTLNGFAGADRLFGEQGRDFLSGGNGDDTVDGGNNNDLLRGDNNNDLLLGGAGRDRLFGNSGNDNLDGGSGNDFLLGGGGKDTLDGGMGNDTLNGAGGQDLFVFQGDTVFDSSAIGVDSIIRFAVGKDKIGLAKTTFTALDDVNNGRLNNADFAKVTNDNSVANSDAEIVYNQNNGNLFYRSDLNGEFAEGVLFAVVKGSPNDLSAADFEVIEV